MTAPWYREPIGEALYEFVKRGGDGLNAAQFEAWLEIWDGTKQVGTSPAYSMPYTEELLKMKRSM